MPLSMFAKNRPWFGEDEADGPTPLFPPGVIATSRSSMFPTPGDASPVTGSLRAGWKGLGDWLNAPASSEAGTEGDLLGYKPTSRIQAFGDALGGAAKGVLHARGPYSNWFGEGLLGATEGLESSRANDLKMRSLAQQQQFKNAELAMKRLAAQAKDAKGRYLTGKPGDVIYDTQAAGGTPSVLAQIPDTTTINGQLVDKSTGERIGAAVPNQPTTIEGAAVQGLPLGPDARRLFNADITQATKPVGTSVTMSPAYQVAAGETKYQQKMGETQADNAIKYMDAGTKAEKNMATTAQMRALITKDPATGKAAIDTGAGAALLLPVRQLAAGAGVGDTEKLGLQEAFNALASQRLQQAAGGSLGAGVSNADVAFLKAAQPSLGMTPQGNNVLLDFSDKRDRREMEIAKQARDWEAKYQREGGTFSGRNEKGQTFDQALAKWAEDHPLFSEEDKKRLLSGAAQPAGGSPRDAY